MNKKPEKWVNVYPQGTKEGDEEQKLFICLARNAKFDWRSVSHIAKETGLTKERVEEILSKYYKRGMVFQSSTNADMWAYWERVPHLVDKDDDSIADKNKKARVDKVLNNGNNSIVVSDFIDLSTRSSAGGRYKEYEKLRNIPEIEQSTAIGFIEPHVKSAEEIKELYYKYANATYFIVGEDRKTFYPYGKITEFTLDPKDVGGIDITKNIYTTNTSTLTFSFPVGN